MKKYFSMFAVAVLGLFTACSEEALVSGEEGGELTTITVNAPQQVAGTRAGSNVFADPALTDMRVALIISTEDNKVITVETQTHSFGDGSTACTFEARLYKGKTYNISVWADYGATYYTIPTQPTTTDEAASTLPVVKMASTTITGSNNNYDAYFGNVTQAITDNSNIAITLTRPFALVKVNTTDWDENAIKLAGYRPDNYTTTFTTPTQLNLVSGVADDTKTVTTAASIVCYDTDGNPKELHYDYLFANTTSSILPDFTVVYKQGTTDNSDYTFENIPVQRNYQTNITGNILTKKGNIIVTINPAWNIPDKTVLLATSLEEAQNYVQTSSSEPIVVKVSEQAVTNATTNNVVTKGGRNYLQFILKSTSPDVVAFELPAISGEDFQRLGEPIWLVTYEPDYPTDTVSVDAPEGSKVKIEAPTSHVIVPAALYAEITAMTGPNTFVVPNGTTVTDLIVNEGGLEIHGTVTNLTITETNHSGNPVKARTSENLSQSVFNVIYTAGLHDYIDRPYYYEEQNSNGTWNIKPYTAETSELSISKNNVIVGYTSMAAFRDYVNAGNDFSGYTVTVLKDLTLSDWSPIGNCDGIAFSGTFDGDGKTITLTKSNISVEKYGLFAYLKGTSQNPVVVKDLNLAVSLSTDGTTKTRIGGVAALAEYAQFTGITVTGSIAAGHQAGGLTGWAACDASFTDCTNKASISVTIPASTGYSIFSGITAQAYGTVTFTNCRNEGALTADHTSNSMADSYIGHIVGKGPYPNEGGSITMTDCTYDTDATITGWNVLATDMNTYPFEGVISGQSRSTYFEQSNPGKLLIGGYFNKCTISGVETSWQYPNGVAHIQMTAAAYLSGDVASRGFYYSESSVYYKSLYDKNKFNSKAGYSEQFKSGEYTCYVPLTEMATVIGTFGDGFNSSLTWAGGTPMAADWATYKTALASYTFSKDTNSDACWSTSDSKIVHIYGTKVNDSTGKITIKTEPMVVGLGSMNKGEQKEW